MPIRAKFAAAANAAEHKHAALLQPLAAQRAQVKRRHRHGKAAVAVQQGRALTVVRRVAAGHDKIRDALAVRGDGVAQLRVHLLGSKARRLAAQRLRRQAGVVGVQPVQRGRGEKIIVAKQQHIALPRLVHHLQLALAGQRRALRLPAVGGGGVHPQLADAFVQHMHKQAAAPGQRAIHRLARARGEQGQRVDLTRAQRLPVQRQQHAGVQIAPGLVQPHNQLAGHHAVDVHLGRQRQRLPAEVGQHAPVAGAVKAQRFFDDVHRLAAVRVEHAPGADRQGAMFSFQQAVRLGKRLAALPQLDLARIARGGGVGFAQHHGGVQAVRVAPGHAVLAGRQLKTLGDKGARVQVVFAQAGGVAAIGRQRQ